MSKSKLLAVFIALILAVTLTTGCSQEEMELLQLTIEMSEIPVYEASGEVSIALQGIPVSSTDTLTDTLIAKLLEKGITLKFNGKLDQEKGLRDVTISYVDEVSGNEQIFTRIIVSENILYLKIDELYHLINLVDPENSNRFKMIYEDVEYISLTPAEHLASLEDPEEEPDFTDTTFKLKEFNTSGLKILRGLPEVFPNYSSELIIKNGNTYTFAASGTQTAEFVFSLIEYCINNITDLEKGVISFINNLTDEEMIAWDLDPQQKTGYLMDLEMATLDIMENKELYLQDINDLQIQLQDKEIQAKLNEFFKIRCSISKTEQDTYKTNFALAVNNSEEQLSLLLTGTEQYKKTSPFTITFPTTGVISYTEALNRLDKSIEIQVDNKVYTYTDTNGSTQGNIEVKNIENQTYLPMRQIAQLFGEKVGWDAVNSQAYVLRGNQKIFLTGIVIDGNTYIKTREFTKLDYEVSWDSTTRTVLISVM
jgi:hypothetical protein